MGMRRLVPASVIVALVVIGLAGCSVPAPYGVRLNADGTIDFVDCYRLSDHPAVDYMVSGSEVQEDPIEWHLSTEDPDVSGERAVIVRYGEAPEGYTTVSLIDPPRDWQYVDFGFGRVLRSDLVEGEWQWHYVSGLPWVPEHPCEGVDVDDLERE